MLATFLICVSIYLFTLLGGGAGIAHRLSFKSHPETIEDYFSSEDWEVAIIQVIYLAHLLSVTPYVLIVSGYGLFYAGCASRRPST